MLQFSYENIKNYPVHLHCLRALHNWTAFVFERAFSYMKATPFDIEFIGKKYGRIVILEDRGMKNGRKIILGRCDCGNEKEYVLSNLTRTNTTKSCGCFNKQFCTESFSTHNLSKHPLYRIWKGIKNRCYNTNSEHFKYYGLKGVVMCDEWLNDFKAFYNWCLTNGWQKGLKIDKDIIPQKLGIPPILYSPEMCSIISQKENCNYKSSCIRHIINNVEYSSLKKVATAYGINYKTLFARVRQLGWDIETAIKVPMDGSYRYKFQQNLIKK